MGHFSDSASNVDRARLRGDPEYLAATALEKFKQNDRYQRGLLTAQAFSRALDDLGLRYGQPEVEDILQYCIITNDGYVHYKDLMAKFAPAEPRAKRSSLKSTIFPEEDQCYASSCRETAPSFTTASSRQRMHASERPDDIRQAYARWDRGLYSNEAFKTELEGLGITLTKEFDRLLVQHNSSRDMPFGQLMSVLQIDEIDGRKARGQQYLVSETDASSGVSAPRDASDFQQRRQYDDQSVCSSSVTAGNGDLQSSLRQAICDFVDGRIPAITFRRQLHQGGVPVPPDLDRLIRLHECDNSIGFRDFARIVLRQDRLDHISNLGCTPSASGYPSVPPSPSASGAGGPTGGWQRHQAASEVGSSYSGYRAPRTPYATAEDLPLPTPSGRSTPSGVPVFRPSSEASSRPGSSSGGVGYRNQAPRAGNGNFLRWDEKEPSIGSAPSQQTQDEHFGSRNGHSGAGSRGLAPPPKSSGQRHQSGTDMANCLAWPATHEPAVPSVHGECQRPGKRFYGDREAAKEILPWADAPPDFEGFARHRHKSIFAAPFGTDGDLARQPRDSGTEDYRPAQQAQPRM